MLSTARQHTGALRQAFSLIGNQSSSAFVKSSLLSAPRRLCKTRKTERDRHLQTSSAAPRLTGGLKDEELQFKFGIDSDDAIYGKEKQRLDAFLSSQLPEVSRAKLQSGIRSGLVLVNGKPQTKSSHQIKFGDIIYCKLPPPAQLDAEPEDIPLQIVFEDEHILVVNKAAGMVIHPSPGNYSGTLVNALLHHCKLPSMQVVVGNELPPQSLTPADELDTDTEDGSHRDFALASHSASSELPVIRPGIVHRLDKGTTGLMVVAKDDYSHANLCEQFKAHSVQRAYQALHVGVPKTAAGTVETNIVRDPRERLKMTVSSFHSNRGRHAVSHYKLLEEVAVCRASLVEWRLETGRTHQIRVHAKHMGNPILADETYSGGASTAVAMIGSNTPSRRQSVQQIVKALGRPALHAKTLGFDHPVSKERLQFSSTLPADFQEALQQLRGMS